MAETIGSIQVVATINTKDYDAGKKHIEKGNKELEKSSDDASSTMGSKWGNAALVAGKAVVAGLAAATAAVTSLSVASIKGFADQEQLIGGVETLFKSSSDEVIKAANNAFKTAGLTANQYMETVTSFSASLLQGLKGDTAEAARISDMAVTDMADNANKMGTDMARIQDAYQGFAKDNFTMLDNLKLGYGGTAGEMARLVNESGVMGDSFKATAENVKDIPFDKLIESIHVVQTELGITGTTALEASETISGSFNAMRSSWSNLITGMSDKDANMDTLISNFVDSAATFGKNVIPKISTSLDGIVKLVDELAPMIINELPKLLNTLLPPVINTFIKLIVTLVDSLPKLIPVLVKGFFDLLKGLLKAIPMVIPSLIKSITSLINSVINMLFEPEFLRSIMLAALALLMGIVQAIPQIIIALVNALPIVISSLVAFLVDPVVIKELIKASITLFGALVLAVPQILGALVGAFGSLISQLWTKISHNFSQFGANFGKSIGEAVKNGINGALRWVIGQVNSIIDMVNSGLAAIDKILPGDQSGMRIPRVPVPQFANGGFTGRGGKYEPAGIVHKGEYVVPKQYVDQSTGLPKQVQQAPSPTQNATIVIPNQSSGEYRQGAINTIKAYNEYLRSMGLPQIGVA